LKAKNLILLYLFSHKVIHHLSISLAHFNVSHSQLFSSANSVNFTTIIQKAKVGLIRKMTNFFQPSTSIDFPFLLTLFQQQKTIIATLQQQNTQLQSQENPVEVKERERSLVLVGLPESTASKPSQRVKEDQQDAEDILDELGIQAPVPDNIQNGKAKQQQPETTQAGPAGFGFPQHDPRLVEAEQGQHQDQTKRQLTHHSTIPLPS
jgi:hypothetical protein